MTDSPPPIREQEYDEVEVNRLVPHPQNPNQGDVGAITESMEANGIFGALLVQRPRGNRKRGRILAGNHTWQAARLSGAPTVPVIWLDVDDERALRIMLADNETARKATNDQTALASLLVSLAGTPEGLAGTGHDGDDLDTLLADIEAAGMDEPEPMARGVDLAVLDAVSVTHDPAYTVNRGDRWTLGPHTLVCLDVLDEHHTWGPLLADVDLFVPYPGVYAALTEKADRLTMLLVQPDPFLAGHVVEKYAVVKGADSVAKQ